MDKLIINHGERVTEHEIGDTPLVIGRDPECDLFFADKKLSRRHARFERAGAGVRLVDLGSRNGSWVNEARIDERELEAGDEIRLGGLRIGFERESSPGEEDADQSTVYLTGPDAPEALDTGTVVFVPEAAPPAPPEEPSPQTLILPGEIARPPQDADDSSTVFLSARESLPEAAEPAEPAEDDSGDETLKKPEPERTVVYPGQASGSPHDTGAVMYRGEVDPSLKNARARMVAREHALSPKEEALSDLEESLAPPLEAPATYGPEPARAGRSWAARFTLLVGGLALFALLVLALPLMRIFGVALVEESELRARALVELLAAANESALGEGRPREASIERVVGEAGVTAAYVVSPAGEILAPRARAGEKLILHGLDGLDGSVAELRGFRSGVAENGDRILAQPISHRGRRVGVAVLTHRSSEAALGWAALALVFGLLLLAIAVGVTVLVARRMTVLPLNDLRTDVEAIEGGRAEALPIERPYGELSQLARSLNRLLASRPTSRQGDEGGVGAAPADTR